MRRSERILAGLLDKAGVGFTGEHPWDIQVRDQRFFGRVLRERSLGLGESYMERWWECERLDQLFERICASGLDDGGSSRLRLLLSKALERLLNLQSRRKAPEVARKHYDLGNDMFLSWLDGRHQYSCGYFAGTRDLDEAQLKKLELICAKLGLKPGDTLLDIGCGWGGLARYAAERHGCSVTGVSISGSQVDYARQACAGRDLDVKIALRDYRDLKQSYDKIVSVGMFEHVGPKNYRTFMRVVHRCLAATGVFLLQSIGCNVSTGTCDPWIRKYIFPNGRLPSLHQIVRAAEGLFVIEDVHNLGPHYDTTLMVWNERFQAAWPRLRERYQESFKRMWEYYLLSCAGAFRARALQLWQVVMTKPGTAQPACRGDQLYFP